MQSNRSLMRRQRDRQWTHFSRQSEVFGKLRRESTRRSNVPIPDSSHLFHILNFVHGNFKHAPGLGIRCHSPKTNAITERRRPTGSPLARHEN